MCQQNIGGYNGLHCTSCARNGAGQCDEIGCPPEYRDRNNYIHAQKKLPFIHQTYIDAYIHTQYLNR